MPEILGYARVSTADQDVAGQVLRLQEAGATRIYKETASGRTFARKELSKLLGYARPGDTIMVVRLDRLGRSLKELIDLVEDIKRRGIGFASLKEGIDTSSAAGKLVFHIFCSLADFERELIVERTREGIAAARAKGKKPGRPSRDVTKCDAGRMLVTSGMSVTEAARQVGISRATLYRHLRFYPIEQTAAPAEPV